MKRKVVAKPQANPKPKGRPSSYTPETAAAICDRIMRGEGLKAICCDDAMPDHATVFRWLAHPERQDFRDLYAHARETQMEVMADEILEISDESSRDVKMVDGEEVTQNDVIQRAKLRVDTRKWLMSKLAPKKYSDKQQIEHSGGLTLEQILTESQKLREPKE